MEEVILFLMTFILLFVIYQVIFILPLKKKDDKKNNKDKELLEIRYLKSKYNLDFDKISYKQLLQLCAITSCLDISIAVTVVSYVSSFFWEIAIGFVVICILIFSSYHLIYLFYKKKGMVKNGKHK